MSTSALHRVYRTTATEFTDFRNGHGSGPPVWGHLLKVYLDRDEFSWCTLENEPLWELVNDNRVPDYLRLCLAFTCDRAICPTDKFQNFAEACRKTAIATHSPNRVNHWNAIADAVEGHTMRAKQIGVGLGCTSVYDAWYDYDATQEAWDIFSVLETKPDTRQQESK